MPLSTSQRRWLAVVGIGLYWMLLLTLTHWPGKPEPVHSRQIPHLDKLEHLTAFAGLAALACVGVAAFRPVTPLAFLGIAGVLAAYAALDELTQGWVRNRTPDMRDWIADMLGMAMGIGAFLVARRLLGSHVARTASAPAAD
jgi:Predicted integral membrane protein